MYRLVLMVILPLMTESLFHGYINPYGLGLIFPIPYYMEIMGVDRPWHTWMLWVFKGILAAPPPVARNNWYYTMLPA